MDKINYEQKTYGITDIGTFLLDYNDVVFNMWTCNETYHPRPVANPIMRVKITNAMEIPGDVLLECKMINESNSNKNVFRYYRLSEIRLERDERL